MGGYGGEVGAFQSVMIVSNLPVGEFKQVSINSVKSTPNPKQEKPKPKKLKKIVAKNELIKSEIKVAKTEPKTAQNQAKDIPPSNQSGEMNSIQKDSFASAPMQGSGQKVASPSLGSGKSKIVSWKGLVASHLNKFKKYPSNSLISEEEGKVVLKVKIDKDGNVLSANIKKACKFESLNGAALRLFSVASPLPKPPENLMGSKSSIILNMPIEYDIKKYLQSR